AFDGDILASTGVTVAAAGAAAVSATLTSLSIGLGSITGSVVDAEIYGSAATTARYGGGVLVTSGLVEVAANVVNTAFAKTDMASGGLLVVTVSVPTARIAAATTADFSGRQTGGSGLTVRAVASNSVDATSGGIAFGLIGVSVSSAEALITSGVITQARMLPGSSVNAPNAAIAVEARATNAATAAGGSVNGGAVTVAVSRPKAFVDSVTSAQMSATVRGGAPNSAGAASLAVQSTGLDSATAKLKNTSGGAITIDDGAAHARVRPTVETIVGGANAPIIVVGDVQLGVAGQPLSRSYAENFSVGALAISTNAATAETLPTVRLSIVPDAVLTAGGRITLVAHQNTESPVVEPGKEFDAVTGVDPGTETITLSADHGLADGATVTYQARGGTPVGGLTSGGRYNVLVVSPNSLQLGSSFDAAQVVADTDTIVFGRTIDGVFVPLFHNLADGQRVIYSMPGGGAALPGLVDGRAYRVRVLDDYRIQLIDAATPGEVSFTGGNITGGNTITQANTYTDGQAVQYVAPGSVGAFTSTRVDIVVDANGAPIIVGDPPAFQTADNNRIAIRDHGLTTGQQVMYRATGGALAGLANNTLYYVIRISAHEIQLADTLCHATGTCPDGDELIPVTPLALTPDTSEAGRVILHQLFAPGQQPIAGLENGGRYYIVGRTATTFQLALTPGGAPIALVANGSVGTSRFVPAVADLGAGTGTHRLAIDLTSDGSGTQALAGVGVAQSLPGGGVVSEAKVSGEGGGFIASTAARPTATVDATLEVTVGDRARITAGGDVNVAVLSNAAGSSDASTAGLGFIGIGSALGLVTSRATTTVWFKPGSDIRSGGSVLVDPKTLARGDAYATSQSGGFGHGVDSRTKATLSTTARTVLDGTVVAFNDITVRSATALRANLSASASGASFAGSSSSGECNSNDCHVIATNDTKLTVGGGAYLEADNVRLEARLADTSLRDENRSNGDGAFEDSDARSEATLNSTVRLELLSGAKIVGYQSVTLIAEHRGISVVAVARASCGCFGGDSDADANASYNATSHVDAQTGVTIRTARLDVKALHEELNIDGAASTGGGFIDFGGSDDGQTVNAVRTIFWEADVILHAANPTLIVDAAGRITKLYAVTVRDELNNLYGLGDVIPAGRTIVVADIINSGGGVATFFANVVSPDSVLTGTLGSFRVQNTFDFVRLHNFSSRHMQVNAIQVANLANVGATVNLQLDDSVAFRFSIRPPLFLPTEVDITNFDGPGTPDLILNGLIDNPIGSTRVVNQHGDILAGPAGPRIRTNTAVLMANAGTIGVLTNVLRTPIPIILVQSDYFIGDVDPARYVSLVADALLDVVLDITYSLRAPADSIFPSMAPVIGPIHAGRNIDLVINDSTRGSDVPPIGSHLIQVNVVNPPDLVTLIVPPSGTYHTYFHPDAAVFVYNDPVLIAWGTNNTPADSAYEFTDLSAGNNIDVRHPSLVTTITFEVTSNVDATLSSMQFPAQSYSTTNGNGEISLHTNGWIIDLETIGDLRVGTITSTADDVWLETAQDTASILDEGTIDDGTARVSGRNIILLAGLVSGGIGGTGDTPDFLEIRSSLSARGSLWAWAAADVLLDQVAGTLYVDEAGSLDADVALRTRAGGIRSDIDDGTLRVFGHDIDLIAVGGTIGADSADRLADLVVDTGGRLYALSTPGDAVVFVPPTGVFVTEATGSLLVLRAEATTGDVRLTVPFVAGGDDESLFVLTDGDTIDGLVTMTEGRIVAGDDVTLLVGQDVIAPQLTVIAGDTVTIRASFGKTLPAQGGSLLYFGGEVTGHAS
ncbi:MAG TPA: hypothetical protein VFY91_10470, partial [Microbacterium sp.]|nr:hypothetical protein [Microbacterium sp.]